MNNNGNEHIILTEQLQNGSLQNRHQTRTQPSASEKQNGLQEEVELLRLEVDRLRDEQQAFQRTPESNDLHGGDKVDVHQGDDSNADDPLDRRGAPRRYRVKL